MVRQTAVVAQGHVFFLPFLVQAFAAALVQVTLFQRYGPAAAQLAGGQAPVLVVFLGRIEQVRPSPGLPGGGRRGTGRRQVFGHGQAAVERGLGNVVVVQRDGQLQRLPVQRRRQVGPEHRVLERADHAATDASATATATVMSGRRSSAAAAATVHGRRRRRGSGLRKSSGAGRGRG